MDLQVKLVDEGHAMTYASPASKAMPSWAEYLNQAYGTTFEPAVFIYNKRLVTGNDIPQDHAAFAKILASESATSSRARSRPHHREERRGIHVRGAGREVLPGRWTSSQGFGATQYRVYSSTGNMLEKTSSGEHLLGYNVLGPYAFTRARRIRA